MKACVVVMVVASRRRRASAGAARSSRALIILGYGWLALPKAAEPVVDWIGWDGCGWFVDRGFLANRFRINTFPHTCGASRLAAVSLVQPNRGLGGQRRVKSHHHRHALLLPPPPLALSRIAASSPTELLLLPGPPSFHALGMQPHAGLAEPGWVDFDRDRVDLARGGRFAFLHSMMIDGRRLLLTHPLPHPISSTTIGRQAQGAPL